MAMTEESLESKAEKLLLKEAKEAKERAELYLKADRNLPVNTPGAHDIIISRNHFMQLCRFASIGADQIIDRQL
jgi:hypothetical protein